MEMNTVGCDAKLYDHVYITHEGIFYRVQIIGIVHMRDKDLCYIATNGTRDYRFLYSEIQRLELNRNHGKQLRLGKVTRCKK